MYILEKRKQPLNYYYDKEGLFRFPYTLKNTGKNAAINIKKHHILSRIYKEGSQIQEEIVSNFKDPKGVSLVPDDISIVHQDVLSLGNAKENTEYFKIQYIIEYTNYNLYDKRLFKSSTEFELRPVSINGEQYVFDDNIVVITSKDEADSDFKSLLSTGSDDILKNGKEKKIMIENSVLLPDNIKINNVCVYTLIILTTALFCRLILCIFKMLAIKQGEADLYENDKLVFDAKKLSLGDAYLHSFLSTSGYRTIDDYWLPLIVGIMELITYPILMVSNNFSFIAFWLGIKTTSQWGSWQKSRTAYNRFLLGNIIVLFVSFVFLTSFIKLLPR